MINVNTLVKKFGDLTAVDGLSFEVKKGEVFGLLGPNGAGKTTIINMLVGVLKPDSGEIGIAGFTDPTRPEVRKSIGNAPQKLAVYEKLSAEENLRFFGSMYGLHGSRMKERVDACLAFVGLSDRRKGKTGTFSGGMLRRLNLAIAMLHEPPVLLLDEPTVGVDPQSRNMIFEYIEKLRRMDCTMIYTTHYMEEASRLCDRVAIIDHGRILAMDTVDKLIAEHGGKSVIEAELVSLPADQTALPGRLEENRLRIDTDKPMEELARLTKLGLDFAQLKVDRPDLETVFLNLTGRSLRD